MVKTGYKEVKMTKRKARRVVLLPDIHYPYHDESCLNAVFHFLKWFKPDEVVLLGDAMDMTAASHWLEEKGKRRTLENKRIKKEYDGFDKDILSKLEKILPKNCKRVYLGGNHEDFIYQVVEKNPRFEGMLEPEIVLNLAERGWKWIPWQVKDKDGGSSIGTYRVGKLLVFHGMYTNMYHAKKTVGAFSRSVAYGHTHDVQLYAEAHVDDLRSYHTAQSIGCLCKKSPAYMKGFANRWVNAFGIVYVLPDGNYNLYVPIIIKGKFVFANKVFGDVNV